MSKKDGQGAGGEAVEQKDEKPKEPEQFNLLPDKRPTAKNAIVPLDELPKTLPGPKPSDEMVGSVKSLGVMEPVILAKKSDGSFRVLDGRRRILAARAAELVNVPARVYEDEELRGAVVTLVLNEQRTSNPIAEAEAIQELLRAGASEKDVARDCRLSISTVRARMRLMNGLNADLKKALRTGKIGVVLADRISKMYPEAQVRLAGVYAEKGKLTATDVDGEAKVRKDAALGTLPVDVPEETGVSWRVRVVPALESALSSLPKSAPNTVREQLEKALNRITEWGSKETKEAAA